MEEQIKIENKFGKDVYELLESLAIAIVMVMLIFTFLFRVFVVKGPSMLHTLTEGDRVVASNLFYTPSRGDVIIFSSDYNNGEILVKRIIGITGDTIDIKDGDVYVNGNVIHEPYLDAAMETVQREVAFPLTVKENELFVMGDNRTVSLDSRSSLIGLADTRRVLGKVIFRMFPNTGVVGDGK